MSVSIVPLTDIALLRDLARDAVADGHAMVSRTISDWEEGTNRFDRDGERLYIAKLDGEVAGVCGLNIDPYVNDVSVGRVRHLYIPVAHRREGIGSLLVDRIIDDARKSFATLRLRTRNPVAAAFYRSRGFVDVINDETCTHRLDILEA